jgi:hypothetical protein
MVMRCVLLQLLLPVQALPRQLAQLLLQQPLQLHARVG